MNYRAPFLAAALAVAASAVAAGAAAIAYVIIVDIQDEAATLTEKS